MKKKVTKPDPDFYRAAYITYMDYFATGEGRTLEINFCYADSDKEAIERHLDRFYGKDDAGRQYFGVGVEAARVGSKRAKEVISSIFKRPQVILDALKNAGVEFHWKFYFNYS
jgi:hypothetical protein